MQPKRKKNNQKKNVKKEKVVGAGQTVASAGEMQDMDRNTALKRECKQEVYALVITSYIFFTRCSD